MKQLKSTTIAFYLDAYSKYNDDELNRYFFDLQTAFDAIENRIGQLYIKQQSEQ
jgi:hypothetical protein